MCILTLDKPCVHSRSYPQPARLRAAGAEHNSSGMRRACQCCRTASGCQQHDNHHSIDRASSSHCQTSTESHPKRSRSCRCGPKSCTAFHSRPAISSRPQTASHAPELPPLAARTRRRRRCSGRRFTIPTAQFRRPHCTRRLSPASAVPPLAAQFQKSTRRRSSGL
jgi:hypothetical protein